jgi:type I restriction enzyme S subunit
MPEKEGLCVSEFLVMIPNEALSCKQFLFHYFLSYLFTDVINGATFGSKMPRADWKIVGNFKLFLPPLPVQHTIADFLDCETIKVDKMVGKIEKQIELLNEYKQSLITHAVTGKIDVRDEINAQNS